MTFKELTAVFVFEAHNFKVLHWMAKGKQFDRVHTKLSSDYYDMVSADADVVAEYGLRLDETVPSYPDVLSILKDSDIQFEVVEGSDFIDYETFVEKTNHILGCILKSLFAVYENEEVKKIENVGIKSGIEGLIDKYDLEMRFLNKRRI